MCLFFRSLCINNEFMLFLSSPKTHLFDNCGWRDEKKKNNDSNPYMRPPRGIIYELLHNTLSSKLFSSS
jgi:hypothetical protein